MLQKSFWKRAFHHDGVRRYGANTLWLMAEKVIRLAVGFSVGVYVARSLGPTQYGLLNYAISYVAIFSVISTLGLDQIVLRELVRHPEQSDRLLGTTFGLRLAGTGIMLTLLAFSLFFHPAGGGLIAIIGAGYCCSAFQVIEFYFQSKVRSKYIALSQIIALLVVSGCKIWAAGQGAALYWFAGIEAFYMVLMFLIYLVFFQSREGDCRNWRFDSRIARAILTDSWPYLAHFDRRHGIFADRSIDAEIYAGRCGGWLLLRGDAAGGAALCDSDHSGKFISAGGHSGGRLFQRSLSRAAAGISFTDVLCRPDAFRSADAGGRTDHGGLRGGLRSGSTGVPDRSMARVVLLHGGCVGRLSAQSESAALFNAFRLDRVCF